jgi:hypothetical protein
MRPAVVRYLKGAFAPALAAQWATVLVALGAIWFAAAQISATRDGALETHALGAFQKHVEIKVQYPEIAVEGFTPATPAEDARYQGFLHSLALAGEALLMAYPGSREWRDTVRGHLAVYCLGLVRHFTEGDLATYHPSFQRVFREARGQCR